MPSLTRIHLGSGPEGVVPDEVDFHLSSRLDQATPSNPAKSLTISLVRRMQEVFDQPFPKPVDQLWFSESKGFSQLSGHLTGLTKPDLHLVDAANRTVFDICSCTSLVSLELYLDCDSPFPPEGLLVIAIIRPHLQRLTVTLSEYSEVDGSGNTGMTVDVIQGFAALLSGLSCFRLKKKSSLAQRAQEKVAPCRKIALLKGSPSSCAYLKAMVRCFFLSSSA